MKIYRILLIKSADRLIITDREILPDGFRSSADALAFVRTTFGKDGCVAYRIREYDAGEVMNKVSFDESDTGAAAFYSNEGVLEIIREHYLQKSDIVMSEMLRYMLKNDDAELHDLAILLSEVEINALLRWSGDDEWVRFENGNFIINA